MSLNFYSNFVVNLVKLLLFFYVMNNKFALIIYLIYITIITKLQNKIKYTSKFKSKEVFMFE